MKSFFIALFLTLFSNALLQFPPPPPETPEPLMNSPNAWLASQGMAAKLLFRLPPFRDFVDCVAARAKDHPNPCINKLVAYDNVFPDTAEGVSEYYSQTLSNLTEFCASDCDKQYRESIKELKDACYQEGMDFIKKNPPPEINIDKFNIALTKLSQGAVELFRKRSCVRVNRETKTLCVSELFDFAKKHELLTKPPQLRIPKLKQYIFGLGGIKSMQISFLDQQDVFSKIPNSEVCTNCNIKWLNLTEEFFANHVIPFDEAVRLDVIREKLDFNKQFVGKVNEYCPSSPFTNPLSNYDVSKLPAPTSSTSSTSSSQVASQVQERSLTSSAPSSYSLAWTAAALSLGSVFFFAWAKMK